MDFIEKQYNSFESFSKASANDIFGIDTLGNALCYQGDTFASTMFENKGDGTFSLNTLPEEAQMSPIKSVLSYDVDNDKNLDLILGGNIFSTHPAVARLDGGNGLWMKGGGTGEFRPIPSFESGLYIPKDVKDIKFITTSNGRALLIANNDGPVQVFDIE